MTEFASLTLLKSPLASTTAVPLARRDRGMYLELFNRTGGETWRDLGLRLVNQNDNVLFTN